MAKNKLPSYSERRDEWCGIIEDATMYERWKRDEIDFKDHIKPYITHIKMPYDVVVRLMKMDRVLDEWSKVPDLEHILESVIKPIAEQMEKGDE